MADPFVSTSVDSRGVAETTFFHPKSNAMPSHLLQQLATQIDLMADREDVRLVVLKSLGPQAFCAGASFDELLAIQDMEQGKAFFMGFARVLSAMRRCPKIILSRVHAKAVGGGVGLICAADYAVAVETAELRLSELNVGIAPLVIGPFVERKAGKSAYMKLSLEADWVSARWGLDNGIFSAVLPDEAMLDAHLNRFIEHLLSKNPDALLAIKRASWQDGFPSDELLEQRATLSGQLTLSTFTKTFIQRFKK